MRSILFSFVVLFVGCASSPDAPLEYPLCADIGCENAFCNNSGVCVCDTVKCTLSPTCESIGCDPDTVTCTGFAKWNCSCPIDGVDTKCTVLQSMGGT